MPSYEVSVTASFFVQAENKEEAGHLLDYWWRLLGGADVDKSYQLRQSGAIYPRRWSVGDERAASAADHLAHSRHIQELMNRHRERFKFDEASVKLIEEAEHEFEDV